MHKENLKFPLSIEIYVSMVKASIKSFQDNCRLVKLKKKSTGLIVRLGLLLVTRAREYVFVCMCHFVSAVKLKTV